MTTDQQTALEALAQLNPARADEYSQWITVGQACHAAGLSCSDWDNWSRHSTKYIPGTCAKKWATFGRSPAQVSVGTLVHMAREDGGNPRTGRKRDEGHALTWDSPIGPHTPPQTTATPAEQIATYLKAIFQPQDHVSYVLAAFQNDKGKYIPANAGTHAYTAQQLIERLERFNNDLDSAIGTPNPATGAWIRANPVDGHGATRANITDHRFCLVESDTMPTDQQLETIKAANLPCAAIVHSGGKSIHAIVHIDAGQDATLYRDRVTALFKLLEDEYGFKVDPACKDPTRLSRMPGITRGDQTQALIATNTGPRSYDDWQADRQKSDLAANIHDLGDLATPPEEGDPNELIRHRYLSRTGALLLVAPTGIGKSSLALSIAAHFAINRSFLGIPPARALRTLIVQAENDEGDMAEMRDGILTETSFTPDEQATIRKAVRVVHDNSHAGPTFATALRAYLEATKPDLLIIDPALAYLGGDASQQRDVTIFLRNIINPILTEYLCGLILVHHGNKPRKGEEKGQSWQGGDFAYLGAGAAEWANWARAVIAIETVGDQGNVYRMRMAKRGKRLRWTNPTDGTPITTTYIAHSRTPGVIGWRLADQEEIPKPTHHNRERSKTNAAPPASAYLAKATEILTNAGRLTTTRFEEALATIEVDGKPPADKTRRAIIKLLTEPGPNDTPPIAEKPKREQRGPQYIQRTTLTQRPTFD